MVENIPIFIKPFPEEDSVATEDEIEWVVGRLRDRRSRGPSRMITDHLRQWLREDSKAEESGETQEGMATGS